MNYIEEAMRTNSPNFPVELHKNRKTVDLLHAAIGMSTESGEFLDALKKHLFYGKPLDFVNLAEELGDMCWYVAVALNALGLTFEDVQQSNINKLRARYPEKFTAELAENRDLVAERTLLEEHHGGTALQHDGGNG